MERASILCRVLGHKPSRRGIKLDAFTFNERRRCSRCQAELIREGKATWQPGDRRNLIHLTAKAGEKK
jgi:hypothetical protein